MKIPKKLEGVGRTDTLAAGSRKALGNFIQDYGSKEGQRIFLAKAEDHGKGSTLRQKVNSIYRKGSHLK